MRVCHKGKRFPFVYHSYLAFAKSFKREFEVVDEAEISVVINLKSVTGLKDRTLQ
jgi:hypothetical protein